MIRKLHNTLSGLLVLASFLGLSLLLAKPLPAPQAEAGFSMHSQSAPSAPRIKVTIDLNDSLGLRKLNLTLPYYAVDKLVGSRSDS